MEVDVRSGRRRERGVAQKEGPLRKKGRLEREAASDVKGGPAWSDGNKTLFHF